MKTNKGNTHNIEAHPNAGCASDVFMQFGIVPLRNAGAGQQGGNPNDNVTDVDYEEVK